MIIGCLREIKNNENRVALTPFGVKKLVKKKHKVLIEKNAGLGSGFSNKEYLKAGARILNNAKSIVKKADLILKVKEPVKKELNYPWKDKMLFTYFHFASSRNLTLKMLKSKGAFIAYETVEKKGMTPLLAPMSEVAGRMSILMAGNYLAKFNGGEGKLLSSVTGVKPAKVVIVGGGFVGENALKNAYGLNSEVVIFDVNKKRLKELKKKYKGIKTVYSTRNAIKKELKNADVLVGAVYIHGAKAPKVVSKEMVKLMPKGSVIVDVAIDQGGSIETSKPTTHSKPVFEKFGVIHYCVANMPGAYPRTSTIALTNATLPYVLKLAGSGLKALKKDKGFLKGLNIFEGKITNEAVAKAHKLKYVEPLKALRK